MKVKIVTLFEQGATFYRNYEGLKTTWSHSCTTCQPTHSDDYIYTHLYRVGEDVILHTVYFSRRKEGFAGYDRKVVVSQEGLYDYDYIRIAIKHFDTALAEFLASEVTKPVERIRIPF